MKATIYIPFANADAVKGFCYEVEELTANKYVKMEEDEYYTHKDGVDHMVVSSLGNNMAYNNYKKRTINVKNQTYAFHRCEGNIRNINGSEITVTQLDRLWANKQDSQKIMNINKLSDEEKVFHLPKKDFKIDFDNGKSHAVLKNCKFAKLLSSIVKANGEPMITSFAMIIERIIFTKN